MSTVQVFLSAVDIRGQLLSLYGMALLREVHKFMNSGV
jgi:hypothetical protein